MAHLQNEVCTKYFFRATWKRLKGKHPEGKNFRKLLRRKQSSAKISKISRNTLKPSKSDIFYLLRNLLKYLLRTFFLPQSFQKFLPFAFLPSGSFRATKLPTKNVPKFSPIILSLYFVGPKESRQNFPHNFPPHQKKHNTDELFQARREQGTKIRGVPKGVFGTGVLPCPSFPWVFLISLLFFSLEFFFPSPGILGPERAETKPWYLLRELGSYTLDISQEIRTSPGNQNCKRNNWETAIAFFAKLCSWLHCQPAEMKYARDTWRPKTRAQKQVEKSGKIRVFLPKVSPDLWPTFARQSL